MIGERNRPAALATTVAGVLAIAISALAVGPDGAASALLGLVMVLAFFGAGALPFLFVGNGQPKGFAFLVLGMTYVLRILLGVVVYAATVEASWVDRQAVGLTVIGCALVWVNTHLVVGLSRRRQPFLEP